jgi:hypothetical protein
VSKALRMDVLRPREIEVVGGGDAPPGIALHGAVAAGRPSSACACRSR